MLQFSAPSENLSPNGEVGAIFWLRVRDLAQRAEGARLRNSELFHLAMRSLALLVLALILATSAYSQTLEVPQTQSQNPAPNFVPRSSSTPAQSTGDSTLQIEPAPTPLPPAPQAAQPTQPVDPAVAAAAAAAAAFNALMAAQPTPLGAPPAVAPTPAPISPSFNAAQSEPNLPQVFRGCWQGEVEFVDKLERIPGAHKVGYWTPKTYRLCYKRLGDGPFHLTLSETGVVPNEQILHAHGHVTALATDGRAYAKMRAELHFEEKHIDPGLRGTTFAVDETTLLDCKINGDAMTVTASVYGTRDGDPWFKARWHADFRHVPE